MLGQQVVALEEVRLSCAVSMVRTLSTTTVRPYRGGSQFTQALSVLSFLLTELSSKEVGSFPAKHRLQKTNGQAPRRAFYVHLFRDCQLYCESFGPVAASSCYQVCREGKV